MAHTCHAQDCGRVVPPSMLFCRAHWFALRKPMRDAVWREYQPGQEDDKQPSLRYLAVMERAIAEVAFRPNDEEAAVIAARHAMIAESLRTRAIENGDGDPLEGLTEHGPWSTP